MDTSQIAPRSSSVRVYRRLLVPILLCAAAAGAVWLSSIDGLDLRRRATPVTSVRGWGLERPDLALPLRIYDVMGGGAQYAWMGSRRILFFRGLTPIQVVARKVGGAPSYSISWPDSVGTPAIFDSALHRESPLPGLAKLFRQGRGRAQSLSVSPDGERIAWRDSPYRLHISRLDGTHHALVDNSPGNSEPAAWTADGKRMVTYEWSEDRAKRNVIAVDYWDARTGEYQERVEFPQPPGYALLGQCALAPDGRLAANLFHLPNPPLNLFLLYPSSKTEHAGIHRIEAAAALLPPDSSVESLVYSPRGDRLAWVLYRTLPSPLAPLHRLFRFVPAAPRRVASLWISDTLGHHLREVGHLAVRPHGRSAYLIDYVRWTPDERMLSFVSEQILYMAPAGP